MPIAVFSGWTRDQRNAVCASYLGWTLDAFDFFLMVFILEDVAAEFGVPLTDVTVAIFLTLAMRAVGAFIFGRLADRFGRQPVLMLNILLYSVLEFASGFAWSLASFLVLRALFGVAMGGEWGIGAALTMETIPAKARGVVSGMLQAGYPTGYLLASVVFGLLYPWIGWRGMFMVGVLPALLVLFIRRNVKESPSWQPHVAAKAGIISVLKRHWALALYSVVLMTAFNFFSHGTQDLYPTFLREQHHFGPRTVGTIAVIYNIGAIVGGLVFGSLSEHFGRRRMIVIAALLALPVLPLWAFSTTVAALATGAFLMQFMVQGAWAIIPAHLNELSPDAVRGTFPGFVYQLGNLLASANATIQASIAASHGGNFVPAMAWMCGIVAIAIALLAGFGVEAKGTRFGEAAVAEEEVLS
jgi:MFS transporter, SHS family, lactate transporter